MKRGWGLVAVLVVAVTVPAFWVTAAGGAEEPPGGEWREWRSTNFVTYSDASDRLVRQVLVDLEELRAVLEQTSTLTVETPVPTVLYLFRGRRSFAPYTLAGHGRPVSIAGYFARREDLGFMAIDGDRRGSASGTVFHEFVHHALANSAPGLPLWLEEGLAELYQTFRSTGGEARVGLPVDEHLVSLHLEGLLPLDLMRAVHRDHPVYRGASDHRGRFYAQSWAMVHYLLIGAEQRRGQVGVFLAALRAGVPEGTAFESAFGPPDALEDELRRYVQRRIFPFVKVAVTVELSDDVRARPLPAAEAWTRLGELLATHSPAGDDAERHFRTAIEHDPRLGAAWSGLAGLAEDRADWTAAEQYHRRAALASPADPHVLFRCGAFLLERGESPTESIALLQSAVESAPGLGPAWTHLAAALELAGDDPREALDAAVRAVELMPSDLDSVARLIRVAIRSGSPTIADEVAAAPPTADPEDRRRLVATVVATHANEAAAALVEGRIDDAQGHVDDARRWLTEAADRRLDVRLDELQATLDASRLAERYREAARLAAGGEIDRAIAVLDEILAADPPAELRAVAAEARGRLLAPPQEPPPPPHGAITLVSPGEVDEVNRRIADGDLDGAIGLLEEIDRRVDPDGHSWIDAKIAEIRRVQSRNLFVERYNRAVDLLNEGRPEAAIEVLDALLQETEVGSDADAAARLRERARSALRGAP